MSNFKIFDITTQILDEKLINNNIFNNFHHNGKHFARFNPGIIHLKDDLFLISYRIWIDKYSELSEKYPNPIEHGSPWFSCWIPYHNETYISSSAITNNLQIESKYHLNKFGLSVIKFIDDDIKIIFDQIIIVENNFNYVEDGRLFKDKDNIIRIMFNATNHLINTQIIFYNIPDYNIERFMSIIEIGTVDKILNEINNKRILIKDLNNNSCTNYKILNDNTYIIIPKNFIYIKNPIIFCPYFHFTKVEKNWVPFKSADNKDWVTYFSMPTGSPLIHINVISYSDQNYWKYLNDPNVNLTLNTLVKPYSNEISVSLSDIKNIIYEKVNFFIDINKYYFDIIKFSGGSNSIKFNYFENIAIGHIVIDIPKLQNKINLDKANFSIDGLIKEHNITYQQAENLYSILNDYYLRPIGTSNNKYNLCHHYKYIYKMFFYTFSSNYPFNMLRISNMFTPTICKYNTGVVFPSGIEIFKNEVYVSYGESDNSACIFKSPVEYIDSILIDINSFHPSEYKSYEY